MVAEAGPEAGLGHLARCSGLAAALSRREADVSAFALGVDSAARQGGLEWLPAPALESVPRPESSDAIVVDSYEIPAAVARELAGEAPLLFFEDSGQAPPEPDLVVSPFAGDAGSDRVLAGAEYCCLGPEYWQSPPRSVPQAVRTILVATGGGDPTGRASETAQAIAGAVRGARTTLVAGPQSKAEDAGGAVATVHAPDSLHDLLAAADLAVITAGQTMLEALALGTPALVLPAAENQLPAAERLAERGAVEIAERPDPPGLAETARVLALDPGRRRELSETAQRIVDGRGALRVAERLLELGR